MSVDVILNLLGVLLLTGVQQFEIVYDHCCKIVERRALSGLEVLHSLED